MVYNSIAEIYDSLEATRERLLRSVEGLSAGQEDFRPAPGRWSVADIMEHLAISEGQSVKLFQMILKKAEGSGRLRAADAPFAPVSIEEFVERSRKEKYQSPEMVRPGGGVPLADSLARLRESRAALREQRPRLERVDGSELRFPHPVFGPLDLYQWLAFVGAHEERHLAQVEALKEAMSAER